MTILCVGDSYMPVDQFRVVLGDRYAGHHVHYLQLAAAEIDPRLLSPVRESEGDPRRIAEFRPSPDILVVHGAPVTAAVLGAHPRLRLVCCARGGPVNVDVDAATTRGIPVATTPGKNAAAVAELTIAFVIALARHIPDGAGFLRGGGGLTSTFDGARFLGRELTSLTLGLVGYGQVGRLVAARAHALGVTVHAYDPFLDATDSDSAVTFIGLPMLLATVDVVSLHARATSDNQAMMNAAAFGQMRRGSWFINTARESLVDEVALLAALRSGHVAAAALDVLEPAAPTTRSPLLDIDTVLVTPHIGGATAETLRRGADMVAAEIQRFVAGQPLRDTAAGAVEGAADTAKER